MHAVLVRSIVCIWLACLGTGCQHAAREATDMERTMATDILNARRDGSLKGWRNKRINGEPVLAYTLMRAAVVLPPGIEMASHGGHMHFTADGRTKDQPWFTASAVAVAPDGYYLTAAHCLNEGACTLLAGTKIGDLRVVPARIVWCGDRENHGPDLGLIHAPLTPAGTFPMARFTDVRTGAPVFTGGFGPHGRQGGMGTAGSGGHLVHAGQISGRGSGPRWREIYHDAPLAPGDSGGPLIDETGHLLGINAEVRGTWSRQQNVMGLANYRGVAICPDADWIQTLIAGDRAASRTVPAHP